MSRLISGVVAFCAAFLLALVQLAPALEIALDPSIDQFGQQIYTIQTYKNVNGSVEFADFGIYDTGASVITFGAGNYDAFQQNHLIKKEGGAGGEGIGGSVIGDVSHPGEIGVNGIQAWNLSSFISEDFDISVDMTTGTRASPIQAFIGTTTGSADLPTLTGTPIHKSGKAAYVDMQGYQLDFGDLDGSGNNLIWAMPSLEFVAPDKTLTPKTGITAPARIALTPYGENNYGSEGDLITAAANPIFEGVKLTNAAAALEGKKLLFDTGAQVTLISTDMARDLGLNLAVPETTVEVQGASGTPISLPGFTLSGVELAAVIEGASDIVKFSNVPVYVYDLNIPGLDGILGMNVFNTADQMLIDPVTGQLTVSFFDLRETTAGDGAFVELLGSFGGFAGHIAPAVGLGQVTEPVPEPAAGVLLLIALAAAFAWRRR